MRQRAGPAGVTAAARRFRLTQVKSAMSLPGILPDIDQSTVLIYPPAMNSIPFDQLTPKQLRQAAKIKERIESLQKELKSLLGESKAPASTARTTAKPKRRMSAAAKAKLSKAAKERWAKVKASGKKRL